MRRRAIYASLVWFAISLILVSPSFAYSVEVTEISVQARFLPELSKIWDRIRDWGGVLFDLEPAEDAHQKASIHGEPNGETAEDDDQKEADNPQILPVETER